MRQEHHHNDYSGVVHAANFTFSFIVGAQLLGWCGTNEKTRGCQLVGMVIIPQRVNMATP